VPGKSEDSISIAGTVGHFLPLSSSLNKWDAEQGTFMMIILKSVNQEINAIQILPVRR